MQDVCLLKMCISLAHFKVSQSSGAIFSTSTFNMQWSLVTCQSHTLQVVFFAIPHSFLHVLLHCTGLLWLQQDLLRHLSSHQDKQLPKEKQYH